MQPHFREDARTGPAVFCNVTHPVESKFSLLLRRGDPVGCTDRAWEHCRDCHSAIIHPGPGMKIFVAPSPVDFRKGHVGPPRKLRASLPYVSIAAFFSVTELSIGKSRISLHVTTIQSPDGLRLNCPIVLCRSMSRKCASDATLMSRDSLAETPEH